MKEAARATGPWVMLGGGAAAAAVPSLSIVLPPPPLLCNLYSEAPSQQGAIGFTVPFPEYLQAFYQMWVQNSLGWTHISITVPTGTVPSTKVRRCLMSQCAQAGRHFCTIHLGPCAALLQQSLLKHTLAALGLRQDHLDLGKQYRSIPEFWGGTHNQGVFNVDFF